LTAISYAAIAGNPIYADKLTLFGFKLEGGGMEFPLRVSPSSPPPG
jgi:hypothetical protein